jgi:hypothetical protein
MTTETRAPEVGQAVRVRNRPRAGGATDACAARTEPRPRFRQVLSLSNFNPKYVHRSASHP